MSWKLSNIITILWFYRNVNGNVQTKSSIPTDGINSDGSIAPKERIYRKSPNNRSGVSGSSGASSSQNFRKSVGTGFGSSSNTGSIGGNFRDRKNTKRDNNKGNDRMSSSDDIDDASLNELDHFSDLIKRGYTFDQSEYDPADKFLADLFLNSFKTNDHIVHEIHANSSLKRARIPQSRSMVEIINATLPNITSVKDENTEAYKLGLQSWNAISKNHYFSEFQQRDVANRIAKMTEQVHIKALLMEEAYNRGEEELDVDLDPNYQKIPISFAYEDSINKYHCEDEDDEVVEVKSDETNWDVEAVIDEDQL